MSSSNLNSTTSTTRGGADVVDEDVEAEEEAEGLLLDQNVELRGCININGNALYEGESMPLTWSIDNCKVLIKAKIGEE